MTPTTTTYDISNRADRPAKTFSYFSWANTDTIKLSNLYNIRLLKRSMIVVFSTPICPSAFCNTILRVILRSSEPKMIRIATRRMIAFMTDKCIRWYATIDHFICKAMCLDTSPFDNELSVAVSISVPHPMPAFVWKPNRYLVPKVLFCIRSHLPSKKETPLSRTVSCLEKPFLALGSHNKKAVLWRAFSRLFEYITLSGQSQVH